LIFGPFRGANAANFGEKRGAPGSSLGEPIIKRLRIPIVCRCTVGEMIQIEADLRQLLSSTAIN